MKSKSQVITIFFAVILIFAGLVSAQTPPVPAGQPVAPEPPARVVGASPVPGTDPDRRAQELEREQALAAAETARDQERDTLAQVREQAASVGRGGRGGQVRDQAASEVSRLRDVLGDLNLFSRTSASNIDTVFFIPSGQLMSTEQLIEINEDMNIMARIFDVELNQQQIDTADIQWQFTNNQWVANNIGTRFTTSRSKTESMYLQGYGAVFTLNVNFPLSPLPDTQQQQEQTEDTGGDTVWQQTRQQIYQTQPVQPRRTTPNRNQVQYDAQKVEELKTSLIDSLKHASNIRALQPDESVILSITGYSSSSQIIAIAQMDNSEGYLVLMVNSEGQRVQQVFEGGLPEELLSSTPTALVIRAKKSDIDAFADGQLTSEQFRLQVAVLSYPLLSVGSNPASTSIRIGTNITQTQPPAIPTIGTTGRRSSTVNAPTQSSSSSSTSSRRTGTTTSTDANSTSSNSPAQNADPF